ncbi:GMC oxidoreductase [Devosia sp. SL43]|uniref:GMC oxidoreductase n=1 Tax=Devosia sp. SL43 TaxID=2806348 RepID=UPI001F2A8010|nr:GMC family oxidoreductase [Devosia sp. SL43]UJW87269.1 GMC family oxidoreductase [Devosia sp. SL43]
MTERPDIVIVGSGIGGATIAAGLAPTGARIVILERGDRLPQRPENRDARAIFQRGFFRPDETWFDGQGTPFQPGNYYNVGGNSKFYGAVLCRFRREDFLAMEHQDGTSPAWPFDYDEIEPWYTRAEQLYQVRGDAAQDPTEPFHSVPYPHPPVPDEGPVAAVRERLAAMGLTPYALPLAIDLDRWLANGKTPWDGYPDSISGGKLDAESGPLAEALRHPNVTLLTGAHVRRLVTEPGGNKIASITYERGGRTVSLQAPQFILSAGAIQSAALLLSSSTDDHPQGLANSSGQVGRNFMNHNATAVVAVNPRFRNTAIYQKSFGLNDYYLSDGRGGPPLGNVQLLGRMGGAILKSGMPLVPEAILQLVAKFGIDFYAMSEDLPSPDNRVRISGDRLTLEWKKTNLAAHEKLVATLKQHLRDAGFPFVFAKPFDKRTPSHQCGTVRMGNDPSDAPLDPFCRAYDHPNLFVVDAGFFPSSAALNPALTIAAQALRVADHIASEDIGR